MALEVGINSYVTVAEAASYLADRIDTDMWDTATPADQAKALVTATRMLDMKSYVGQMASPSQSLSWPRVNASFTDPRFGGIVTLSDSTIPERIKNAVIEQTLHILSNENLLESKAQEFERIKVGPIEIEGSPENYIPPPREPEMVHTLIKPLIAKVAVSNTWWRAN